jgi:hypothetical protein
MDFDLVFKGFINIENLVVKNYTNEILEFKTISIHGSFMKTFLWLLYLPKMSHYTMHTLAKESSKTMPPRFSKLDVKQVKKDVKLQQL